MWTPGFTGNKGRIGCFKTARWRSAAILKIAASGVVAVQSVRVERRTRLRAEWNAGGVTHRFFDYVPKGTRPASASGG